MTPAQLLPNSEIIEIIRDAQIIKVMGERKVRRLVVDYIPPRLPMTFVRDNPEEPAIEPFAPVPIKLVFLLEDAMFGGEVYASLTCCGRVVVAPFIWRGYDELAQSEFSVGYKS